MGRNRLNFGSRQATLFSIALLHAGSFRAGRAATPAGRRLYNRELVMARRKIRKYGITLRRPLPDPMEVR